jgi:hypothetical protein
LMVQAFAPGRSKPPRRRMDGFGGRYRRRSARFALYLLITDIQAPDATTAGVLDG